MTRKKEELSGNHDRLSNPVRSLATFVPAQRTILIHACAQILNTGEIETTVEFFDVIGVVCLVINGTVRHSPVFSCGGSIVNLEEARLLLWPESSIDFVQVCDWKRRHDSEKLGGIAESMDERAYNAEYKRCVEAGIPTRHPQGVAARAEHADSILGRSSAG